jgi:excisionase family DNA binding protein
MSFPLGSLYPLTKVCISLAGPAASHLSAKTSTPSPGMRIASASAMGMRSVFVDEAAALLKMSRRTVYYRIREGRLQTIRTPGGSQRILMASIVALQHERGTGRPASSRAASESKPLPL